MRLIAATCLLLLPLLAGARAPCDGGRVFLDRDGDGQPSRGEPGLAGVMVSDGRRIVRSDADGRFELPIADGQTRFVIKPAGYALPLRANGLPAYWAHRQRKAGPALRYGGLAAGQSGCADFGLIPAAAPAAAPLDVLLFGDTQPKTLTDVGYYARDIVAAVAAEPDAPKAALGLTLGDVTDDALELYSALNAVTATLRTPWLHVAGNHDLDFDAAGDADSLRSFRQVYGPDSFAWEEPQANFVVLDDVIYQPGQRPEYVGGLREAQFEFLQAYLATADRARLLVLAVHIPFFDVDPARETFRHADRERLFGLLKEFPRVLLLSAHSHEQGHYFHGPAQGWYGAQPLHEYNVGAACGAYWSGVADAEGIPASTMADGTPNGYARMRVEADGRYALRWHVARDPLLDAAGMQLHAPRRLRRGAFPAYGVYANVFMGHAGSVVEYRIDGGEWRPMRQVHAPDPNLLAENLADAGADALRGYDRSPEATASRHLWRGSLPTDLAVGPHRIEVRTLDPWRGELRAATDYQLLEMPLPAPQGLISAKDSTR